MRSIGSFLKRLAETILERVSRKLMLDATGSSEIPEGVNKLHLVLAGVVAPPIILILFVKVVFPGLEASYAIVTSQLKPVNSIEFGMFGLIFTLITGLALYEFKTRRQWLYGGLEVLASMGYCFYTFEKIAESVPTMLGFFAPVAAALYFTQRGFSNLFDGLKALKKNKSTDEHTRKSA